MNPPIHPVHTHDERLRVPAAWWAMGIFLVSTLAVAVWAILDLVWAVGAAVLSLLALALVLLGYGRARIVADQRGLRAGEARIDWEWVAGGVALDQTQARQRLDEAAAGGTWLLVRPYVRRGVQVDLVDPADPHQHWLLSSRRPDDLAAAITSHVARGGEHP